MNILILTGRFGMGHVKAAEAIRETILAGEPDSNVFIVDFAAYICPKAAPYVYRFFGFLTGRLGPVYNRLNRSADRLGQVPFPRLFLRKIHRLLTGFQPDAILVTMPFLGQYVSACLREYRFQIPLYTFITDVAIHGCWLTGSCRRYFAASEEAKTSLLSRGIPSARITVTGVPVSRSFQQAGILPRKSHSVLRVLVMGGGLGLLPDSDGLLSLLAESANTEVTVICGSNGHLASRILRDYPNFRTEGFTDQVAEYMHESDVLITKPGGVTVFEAIASRTPLLVLPPSLEQEKANAQFIKDAGIGLVLEEESAETILQELAAHPDKLQAMRQNMVRLEGSFSPFSLDLLF